MATASKKTKSKRLPLAKTRPKRKGSSKPLLAVSATVRKSKPRNKAHRSLAVPTIPIDPAFALLDYMGRVMGAYAELPIRLAQCRSPMDLWLEQTRFAQRIFSAYQSTPPSERPSARW